MAIYGQNGTQIDTATQTKQPRTDYKNLIHNGRKFENLDTMIDQIARERAHIAFKSTKLAFKYAGSKASDETIAKAMIEANKEMIREYLQNKDDSRSLFGLQ